MEIIKKNPHKKIIRKLKVEKANYSEIFKQIGYNIKAKAGKPAKFSE